MTWELSYERLNHKIVVYENRAMYSNHKHIHKFGTIQKNDIGQYYFKKAFMIEGILDIQISELEHIIKEIKEQDNRGNE